MSFNTINPATEQVIEHYQYMQDDHIQEIIQHMASRYTTWQHSSINDRCALLTSLAKLLIKKLDFFAKMITEEMGKPITQARAEVEKCSLLCMHYAEHTAEYLKPSVTKTKHQTQHILYQPIGIIFAIMPWNFPMWQVMRAAVTHLAAGNVCLLKHAPNSTGMALAIEQAFLDAGFPEDCMRSIICNNQQAADVINTPQIVAVTLTGSERAGSAVAATAGKSLKKVVLELGGNDPYIVCEDADLDLAAEKIVRSRLANCGQVCIAAKRIIMLEPIAKQLQKKIIALAKNYVSGDPQNAHCSLGPMARDDLRQQFHQQVQTTIQQGATCALGGKLPTGTGYFYPATVLTGVTPDMLAFNEECFGPLICCIQATDEQQAIQLANLSHYGLGSAVFSKDTQRATNIAMQLEAGAVAINGFVASNPALPFGGIKRSGYGRELAHFGMHEFMNIKTIVSDEA